MPGKVGAVARRLRQSETVRRILISLASQLEAIAQRIGAVGLARAAADLRKVAAELRRLETLDALPEVPGEGKEQSA
jgi:hypothetical protein